MLLVYCILWNKSQVLGWIEDLLDKHYYNETLVLGTMRPVDKDKDVSKLGTEFFTLLFDKKFTSLCHHSTCVQKFWTLYTKALSYTSHSTKE